jgi:endonuclease YncB( thermonuclease family)
VIIEGKRIRVRILDIDALEQKQPYGHRSRQSLTAICGGEAATVDGTRHDRNGRMLARVLCNGTDAGAEQVRLGMAWVFVRYAPADSPLYAIEQEARAARRGLGATLQPVPPWEWRGQ